MTRCRFIIVPVCLLKNPTNPKISHSLCVCDLSSRMKKMRILNSLQLQVLQKIPTKAIKPNFYLFSSLTKTPTQKPNTLLFNYLIETLKFSKTEAQSISTRFSHIKSLEKPYSVLHYLRSIGFSQTDIRTSVLSNPYILFSKVDKNLKPKMELFQEMGLMGSHLGKFISHNPRLLACSLEKKLVPSTQILNKILGNVNKNRKDSIRVMIKCRWITTNPSRFLINIAVLESCGIVGSRLSMLLWHQPMIFVMEESKLRDLVSRVLDMGFSVDSGMFVHGLCTVYGLSEENFEKKLEIFRSFGFTKDEFMEIFRRAPVLPRASEKKLKLGMEFFLNKVELEKEVLIRVPWCLMLSLEERVIPRYNVMQILRSKRLLKKDLRFISVLNISEKKFLEKFVEKFTDDAEELLEAYKGHLLDSSSSSEEKKFRPV
ncbi:hypothetical protein ACOSQ2_022250 [Xanthoceras sorbifolium]